MNIYSALGQLPRRAAMLGVAGALALGVALPMTASALTPVAAASDASCNNNVQCIINFGDQRINERLTALSTLSGKANEQFHDGHITSDQNNSIQGDVTTNQNNLTTLKTKLDGETTATAARADVLSIYTTYRIFAVVLPRDYREIALDIGIHIDQNLRNGEGAIQTAINGAPASEQGQLTALFTDYKNQLSNAETQIDAANGQIPSLTPQNYDSNKSGYDTAFQNFKDDENAAHGYIKAAASDLHQIAQILKGNVTPTP